MAVHRRLPKPPASAVSKSTVLVDIEGKRVKIIGRIEIHKGKPEFGSMRHLKSSTRPIGTAAAGAAYPAWCAKKSRFARCSLFDKGRTEYATDGSSESQGNRNEPSWRPRRMAMAINQELSSVVEDRVVKNCREGPSEVEIAFQDGSTMKVKVMESNSPPLRQGSQIRRVYEDGTEFVIDCEDGTTLSLQLIEPGNSVSVRDKNGAVEYRG
jgi:hypothetical protein